MPNKVSKKTSRKPVKKTSKLVKNTSRKPVKKTSINPVKKTSINPVKKTSRKPVKKTSRKPVKMIGGGPTILKIYKAVTVGRPTLILSISATLTPREISILVAEKVGIPNANQKHEISEVDYRVYEEDFSVALDQEARLAREIDAIAVAASSVGRIGKHYIVRVMNYNGVDTLTFESEISEAMTLEDFLGKLSERMIYNKDREKIQVEDGSNDIDINEDNFHFYLDKISSRKKVEKRSPVVAFSIKFK
jgi:hypothetical protein